jgi:hypothetical protein
MIRIGAIEEMTLEAFGLRKLAPIVSLRLRQGHAIARSRTADVYFKRRIDRTEQDPRVNGGTNKRRSD